MCEGPHSFIPVANTGYCQARMLLDGQQIQNDFWITKTDPPIVPHDLVLMTEHILALYTEGIFPLLSNGITGVEIVATDASAEDGVRYTNTAFAGVGGGAGSDALPNNSAFRISFFPDIRGAHAGGIYISGIPENAATGSFLGETTATALVEALQAFQLSLDDDNLALVVVSLCHDNAWRTTGALYNVTTIGYKDLVMDSQRRRLPGRGR